MNCKQVDYAYATSDIANKFNNGEGCWIVASGAGRYFPWPERIDGCFPTEREAIDFAYTLDIPWGRAWLSIQRDYYVIAAYSA